MASPDDVARFLEVTGQVCPEVAGYRFTNVTQLARDLNKERFAAAFPPRKTTPAIACRAFKAAPRTRP